MDKEMENIKQDEEALRMQIGNVLNGSHPNIAVIALSHSLMIIVATLIQGECINISGEDFIKNVTEHIEMGTKLLLKNAQFIKPETQEGVRNVH